MPEKVYVAFGSYAVKNNVSLYYYENDAFIHCLSFDAGIRPSFILFGPNNLLYVVNECNLNMHNKLGCVKTYRINNNFNKVELLSEISSEGEDPCSLTLSADNKYLIVTNYSSSNVLIYSLDNSGIPEGIKQRLIFTGNGKIEQRQECSHPHSSYFNKTGDTLYLADLGTDIVSRYEWNLSSNKLIATQKDIINLNKGDGPRMVVLSEDQKILYIVNELSNTIRLFDTNSLKELSSYSTITSKLKYSNAAHLIVKKGCVFVSNRGEDSIIVIENQIIKEYPCNGKNPRYFTFLQDKLFILNQDSGNVFSYVFQNGKLIDLNHELDIYSPTCMQIKQ